jgi:ribosome-interacting GTPase 1
VEKLEASGIELQHAIQKIAIPEAQARGIGVHEIIRSFQTLAERAIERLMKDHRKGLLPDL